MSVFDYNNRKPLQLVLWCNTQLLSDLYMNNYSLACCHNSSNSSYDKKKPRTSKDWYSVVRKMSLTNTSEVLQLYWVGWRIFFRHNFCLSSRLECDCWNLRCPKIVIYKVCKEMQSRWLVYQNKITYAKKNFLRGGIHVIQLKLIPKFVNRVLKKKNTQNVMKVKYKMEAIKTWKFLSSSNTNIDFLNLS